MIKYIICFLAAALSLQAATQIKFVNHTSEDWGGTYHGNNYLMPSGTTTTWFINVTEPGAWCFDFGPPSMSFSGFGSDIFNEDYEGFTFEYHGFSELVPSDKDGEFPPDVVYTWTQISYPIP